MSGNPCNDRAEVDRHVTRCRRSRQAFRLIVTLGTSMLVTLGAASLAAAHTGRQTAASGLSVAASGSTNLAAAGDSTEPLTAADRDLLVRVRLAGLWESPAGQLAAQKGASPRVREVGAMIGSQHEKLDALVVRAAQQVGVQLPDVPTAEQRGWLDEMTQSSGPEFDQVFVSRLRAAHGKVFPVIGSVRSGTRNAVVRQLAQDANSFVLTHLTLLESTDLVDYSSLPLPPQPADQPQAANGSAASSLTSWWSSVSGFIVPVILLLAIPLLLPLSRMATRRTARDRERYDPGPTYEQYERYRPYDSAESSRNPFPSYAGSSPYPQTSYPESADRSGRRLQTRSRLRP